MEPLGRLEELIGRAAEGLFHPRATVGPAELLRAARRALLRGRRAWFGRDLAHNRVEIRLHPGSCGEWKDVRLHLERELGFRLGRFAGEQGLDVPGPVQVEIVEDETLAPGRVEVHTALVDPLPEARFEGPLVTPSGWAFTGCRSFKRVVLVEEGSDGSSREHLIVFASHLVVGSDPDADLCPPSGYRAAKTVLAVSSRLFVSTPAGWLARSGRAGWPRAVGQGAVMRFARGCSGRVRLVTRDEQLASASIASSQWTLPLVPGDALIGRDRGVCDLWLDDCAVSGQHARLMGTQHGLDIEDLRSANGLMLNARRTQQATMRPGDRLTLGQTDFQVVG